LIVIKTEERIEKIGVNEIDDKARWSEGKKEGKECPPKSRCYTVGIGRAWQGCANTVRE